jgi:hypothetical protein
MPLTVNNTLYYLPIAVSFIPYPEPYALPLTLVNIIKQNPNHLTWTLLYITPFSFLYHLPILPKLTAYEINLHIMLTLPIT